jgi:ABC-type amino acid transport substrate-binding protein
MQVDGKYTGLNTDIVIEAGKRIGVDVEVRGMPFKRIESEMQRGAESSVECAFAFSRTPQREQYMTYTSVVLQDADYVLLVRNGSGIRGLADLAGRTIGVRRGFRLPEAIVHGAGAGVFRLEEVGNDETNFSKLGSQRIDAMLIQHDVGIYMRNKLGHTDFIPLAPPVEHLENYLVFTRGKPAAVLAARFDTALAAIRQDGTYARLRARYALDDVQDGTNIRPPN